MKIPSKLPPILVMILLSFAPISMSTHAASTQTDSIAPADHTTEYTGYVLPISFVVDYYFYNIHGLATTLYLDQLLNDVNEIFANSSLPVYFSLEHVMIFDDKATNDATFTYTDAGGGEVVLLDLLNSHRTYASGNNSFDGSEEVQLLSGRDFEGASLGLGFTGNIGQDIPPYSILQGDTPYDVEISYFSAHQIGNNFALTLDGSGTDHGAGPNNCDDIEYIMSPSSSSAGTSHIFSSCSIDELNAHLSSGLFTSYIDDTNPKISDEPGQWISRMPKALQTVTWTVADDNLGYYTIYKNDTAVIEHEPITGTEISYSYSIGVQSEFELSISIYDLVGHHASDNVSVTIASMAPQIIRPDPGPIYDNESRTLSWELVDDDPTTEARIFENDILVETFNFTTHYVYNYTFDHYEPGIYKITVSLTSLDGQSYSALLYIDILSSDTGNPADNDTGDGSGDEEPPLSALPLNIIAIVSVLIAIPALRMMKSRKT